MQSAHGHGRRSTDGLQDTLPRPPRTPFAPTPPFSAISDRLSTRGCPLDFGERRARKPAGAALPRAYSRAASPEPAKIERAPSYVAASFRGRSCPGVLESHGQDVLARPLPQLVLLKKLQVQRLGQALVGVQPQPQLIRAGPPRPPLGRPPGPCPPRPSGTLPGRRVAEIDCLVTRTAAGRAAGWPASRAIG